MADLEKWTDPAESRAARLERLRDDRIIAGVCAGIARHYGWDPLRVRLAYLIVSALSAAFPGIAVYVVLWFLMPSERRG